MSESTLRRRSLKEYASVVFRQSLVTGLSNIVQTENICRKVFKAIVLLVCIAGFLYQSTTFVSFILTYPSVVDVKVSKPAYFLRPAFTFCNSNGIKRSKFCEIYPSRCFTPTDVERYCSEYPRYCKGNAKILVPKEEFTNFEINMTRQEFMDMKHDLKDFLLNSRTGDDEIAGPFMFSKGDFQGTDGYFGCFTKYARFDSSHEPVLMEKSLFIKDAIDSFVFDVEENETFISDMMPSALFSLHSPYIGVNPFMNGILLRPGRSYKIHLRMIEEQLLPYPYDTNCLNYTEIWIKNNRSGPRAQEMCLHHCTMKLSLECLHCVIPGVLYPHQDEICRPGNPEKFCQDIDEVERKFKLCELKCKDDCSKVGFYYDVQERYTTVRKNRKGDYERHSRYIYVDVYVEDSEVVALYHRPQFQDVEVFSYIGGFIGCWLGISLVAVADFLESILRVTCYFFRRTQ